MTGYASTQCELLATGLKLTNTSSSGAAGLRQYLPSIIPAGTKLTISALGVGGETFTNLAVRFYDSSNNNNDSITTSQMVRDGELVYGSIELTRDCASVQFRVFPYATDFTFEAVKLELGDTQTLAHNEGTDESPVWVLNDLPNWNEELTKCKYYYRKIEQTGASIEYVLTNVMAYGTSSCNLTLPLGMRPTTDNSVTITYSSISDIVLATTTIATGIEATSISNAKVTNSGDIVMSLNATNLTTGSIYNAALKSNGWIAFSTEVFNTSGG